MVRIVGAALCLKPSTDSRATKRATEQGFSSRFEEGRNSVGVWLSWRLCSHGGQRSSASQILPFSIQCLSPRQSTVILAEVKFLGASQQRGSLVVAKAGGAQRVAAKDLQISILQYSISV
ncbi:hypothetical protein JHK87_043112 [Glycine soja]|nr:hypothetical protein JHK87_043112 [Glycine soja]